MTQVQDVSAPTRGAQIEVSGLTRYVSRGEKVLSDISFDVEPGELVAIVGGSGAGKTTLLETIAGVRGTSPDDTGTVSYHGVDLAGNIDALRSSFGYVPQDDIIHKELRLESTLHYAARLRLPSTVTQREIGERVRETLDVLGLSSRAHVRVGSLSGGERRRASIAVELLTRPRVFFLDEPTSGLDPATQADFMRVLRKLADSGSTVVLTTHSPDNLRTCDKVLFLGRAGRVAFFGTPDEALDFFNVVHICDVYEKLANGEIPQQARPTREGPAPVQPAGPRPAGASAWQQWTTLTRRNLDILVRNRLTLAILLGSPVMVVMMFVVLFRPGAFDLADPNPASAVMVVYWLAFGGFFFGITYGLLQIVTEFSIFHRERLVNLGVGAYVLSKLAVLIPFLLVVDIAMLGILRAFDRLPAAGAGTYVSLGITVLLDATAALAIGLFASAVVSDPAQATVALPVIAWPQVLFGGALIPVPVMALAGKVMSYPISDRWAFEALGHDFGLNELFRKGASPLGPPLLTQYGGTFSHAVWSNWIILAGFTAAGLLATWIVLIRRTQISH